ncbi:hypothetical protein [Laceyella putida]|uniref:Uncharacterized protein n=1 Tax=Laceyella putida TaxID=110101 RepID=A0ABW2RRR0_9BACL
MERKVKYTVSMELAGICKSVNGQVTTSKDPEEFDLLREGLEHYYRQLGAKNIKIELEGSGWAIKTFSISN